MNEQDISLECFPVQPKPHDEDDSKMMCLLLLFLAMDDKAREAFMKEADPSCFNAPTAT